MRKEVIDYINGPTSKTIYGMKRYQDEIHRRLHGFRLNRIEYETPGFAPLRWAWKLFFPFKALFSCRKGRVKHITTQFMGYLLLFPQFRAHSVITIYDTIFLERFSDFPFLTRLFIWLNVIGMKNAQKVLTISDYSANQISARIGIQRSRIAVIKPGIDLSKFKPGKSEKPLWVGGSGPAILCLGSEEPRQNIDKVIEAAAILRGKYPGIVLLKAGRPQWKGGRERLLGLVERLGMEKNVKFLDYVPEDRLPSLYRSCDLLVYPSSSVGWGLPPSEAMACGTPVIVSCQGSLPEVVGNTQILLGSLEPKAIARAVENILSSRERKERMRKAGIGRARLFSWRKAAWEMKELYLALQ